MKYNHGIFYGIRMSIGRAIVFLFLLISGYVFLSAPIVFAVSSSQDHRPDAIVVEFDPNFDPCAVAWEKISKKYPPRNLSLGGKIGLDPEVLFKYTCNQCKDYLSGEINSLVESIKSSVDVKGAAKKELDKAQAELKAAFLSWAAEQAREQILPLLSEEDQQRFDNDSEFMQQQAVEYLDSEKEINAYVVAYLKENDQKLYYAYKAYVDLTQGSSAAILKDLNTLAAQAQDRLKRIAGFAKEANEKPDTPTADLMKKYGVKGAWIDNLKAQEGRLRQINKTFKVTELVGTVHQSFSSDLPRHKVEAMLGFLDTVSGLAAESRIPIASLMGDIVQNLVQLGKGALEQVVILGDKIHRRADYCLGAGVATEDTRSQALEKRDLLICPVAFEKSPWKDIYEEVEPENSRLHFWTGKKFIEGHLNYGGKPAVQEIIKLIGRANDLGYDIPTNVKTIGLIYNVQYDKGFLGLLVHARKVIKEIKISADQYIKFKQSVFSCNSATMDAQLEEMLGVDFEPFLKESDDQGLSRLETTYLASFLIGKGVLGKKNTRQAAYKNYDQIWEKTRTLGFVQVSGEVRNQNSPDQTCSRCSDAILNIRVSGGQELRGCEAWKTDPHGNFTIYAIAQSPSFSIELDAGVDHFKSETLYLSGIKEVIPVRLLIPFEDKQEETDKELAQKQVCDQAGEFFDNARAHEDAGLLTEAKKGYLQALALIDSEDASSTCPSLVERINDKLTGLETETQTGITLPNLVGMPYENAVEVIKSLGLTLLSAELGSPVSDPDKIGTVEKAEAEHEGPLLKNDGITLYIYDEQTQGSTVPNVLGKKITNAAQKIASAGLNPLFEMGQETTDPENEDLVYRQDPVADTIVESGADVQLWVYTLESGQDAHVVPNVMGKSLEKASESVKKVGLTPIFELGDETDDPDKDGMVYHQDPEQGTQLESGSDVILTVYSFIMVEEGVPNVVGQDIGKAVKVIETAGFNPVIELGDDTRDPKKDGMVYRQSPKPGSTAEPGSDINLLVYSMAIDETNVPGLTGLTLDQATQKLKDVGLFVNLNKGANAPRGSDQGRVYKQYPEPGIAVMSGIGIDIWVYGSYKGAPIKPAEPPKNVSGGVPYIDIPSLAGFDIVKYNLFELNKRQNKSYYVTQEHPSRPGRISRPNGGFIYIKEKIRYMQIGYTDSRKKAGYIRIAMYWREPLDSGKQNYVRFCDKGAGRPLYSKGGENMTYFITDTVTGQTRQETVKSMAGIDYAGASSQVKIKVTGAETAIRTHKNELMQIVQGLADQIEPYAKDCE